MDGILEILFGPWTVVLLGAAALAAAAVLVPMVVVFSLRMVESGITKSHDAMQVGFRRLASRLGAHRPSPRLRLRLSPEDDEA